MLQSLSLSPVAEYAGRGHAETCADTRVPVASVPALKKAQVAHDVEMHRLDPRGIGEQLLRVFLAPLGNGSIDPGWRPGRRGTMRRIGRLAGFRVRGRNA